MVGNILIVIGGIVSVSLVGACFALTKGDRRLATEDEKEEFKNTLESLGYYLDTNPKFNFDSIFIGELEKLTRDAYKQYENERYGVAMSDNKLENKKPMTRLEWLRSLPLEKYAETRVDFNWDTEEFVGDFHGYTNTLEEAIEKEIEWLTGEYIEGEENFGKEKED